MTNILTNSELNSISGGSFWEPEVYQGGTHGDYYRVGVSFKNCAFSSDEYSISGKRISKKLAEQIVTLGNKIYKSKYHASGDWVGFAREWKVILKQNFSIDWDGKLGTYSCGL